MDTVRRLPLKRSHELVDSPPEGPCGGPARTPTTASLPATSQSSPHPHGSASSPASLTESVREPPAYTSAFSCLRCTKRKVKCDKAQPRCSACARHGAECLSSQPNISDKPRKKRYPEAELLHRISVYERALTDLGLDVEEVRAGKAVIRARGSPPSSLPPRVPHRRPSHRDASSIPVAQEQDGVVGTLLKACLDGKRKTAADDCRNADLTEDTRNVLTFLDEVWQEDGSSALLFPPANAEDALCAQHPAPLEIVRLWQIYLDCVQPVFKALHAPTVQKKVFDMAAKLGQDAPRETGRVDKSTSSFAPSDHALLFAVYHSAVSCCHPDDLEAALGFKRPRDEWIARLRKGVRHWLYHCNLFKTSDLQVLQALLAYLNVLGGTMDPRTLSSFTALLDRLARRAGIHRERGPIKEQCAVTLEMRRRIWYELVLLDTKAVEISGLGISGLDNNWTVRLPSSLSDADLASSTKCSIVNGSSKRQSVPASEMILFMVRCEIAAFLHEIRLGQGRDVGWSEFSTPEMSLHEKLAQIDDLERMLEKKYLVHCDPAHALQRITIVYAKGFGCKLRLMAYMSEESKLTRCAGRSREYSQYSSKNHGAHNASHVGPSTTAFKRNMITLCTNTVALTNELHSDYSLRRFYHFQHANKPFVFVLNLLRLLREHVEGREVERAWATLRDTHWIIQSMPKMATDSPPVRMRKLLYPLLLSAWDARKAAKGQEDVEEPSLIALVRTALGVNAAQVDLAGHARTTLASSVTADAVPRELAVAQTLASQMVDRGDAFAPEPTTSASLSASVSEILLLPIDETLHETSLVPPSSEIDFGWEEWFQNSLMDNFSQANWTTE